MQKRYLATCVLGLVAALGSAAGVDAAVTGILNLPPRQANAMTGDDFYTLVLNMTDAQREQQIVNQIALGNVPNFLRTMKPITVTQTIGGTPRTAVYNVIPMYVAIGSDANYFLMPMSGPLAQQIANLTGCVLPTRKMVNQIYTASTVKLAPFPYNPANYDIDSITTIKLSSDYIRGQFAGQALPLGSLTGGIKKDVIISPTIPTRPSPLRVCIYGWHQLNGSPIQPLSTVHENTYEDYSHGIRLVENAMYLDGVETTVSAVLNNATFTTLLNDEPTAASPSPYAFAYPIAAPYPTPTPINGPTPTATPVPTPTPTNLLTNGSFENGFTSGVGNGWTSWTASGSAAWTFGSASVNKFDGAASQYWSRADTLAVDGGVRQTVSGLTPGATYRLTSQFKRQSTFTGSFLKIGYDLTGGTNATAASVVYTDITGTTDNVWNPSGQSFVATGSTVTVFARGGHTATTPGTNAYFYLDALSLIKTADPATATPSPTPTPTLTPTVTPTPTPVPTSIVVNGSFENGFTAGVGNGWTKWTAAGSNAITVGQAGVNKWDGAASQYWQRADTLTFDGGFYQVVSTTPGSSYLLEAHMKRQSTLVGTSLKFGYDLTGGTNGTAASVQYTDITGATDNVWQTYSTNVTATGSNVTLFARGGHTGTTGGTSSILYLDGVSMTESAGAAMKADNWVLMGTE